MHRMDQSDLTASINYRYGSATSGGSVPAVGDLPPPIMSMGPGSSSQQVSAGTGVGSNSVYGPIGSHHSHALKSPTSQSHTSMSSTFPSGSTILHHNSEKHAMALLEALHSLRHYKRVDSSRAMTISSASSGDGERSVPLSNGVDCSSALCDVILCVNQRRIPAHKVVLAACSPYFRAMFTGELAESRQAEITLHDMEEDAVESLVEYCYTAQITVEVSNVQNLLPAACLLQMQDIQDVCCQFLKKQLDPSNCLGIRAFADTHACRELLQEAERYTLKNFQEVIESEEFLLLPLTQLLDLVHCDELGVNSEEQVYQAVMRWVRHNLTDRRRHLSTVLQHVRLPLLPAKFLVGTVGQDALIRANDQCRDLVDEAKNYLLLPQERPLMQGPRTRPRRPCGEVLYAVGGWCNGDAINTVERFDPRLNEWRQVAPMCKRRCGVGVAVVQELLYAIGGHDGQSYLNSVERYDPHTNQWSADAAPTSSCRTSVGVAVLDGLMYAVGGQDGVSCLNYVECYDPIVNVWTKVSSMNSPRLGVGVAVMNGALYAVGGSDGGRPLSSVEMLDPRIGRWKDVSAMNTRRKHLGVSVHMANLYAVGGRDDNTELSSAEFYDPRMDAWCPVVAMTSRRSGVGLAVVNGHLVAVGGFDGCIYLRTVEQYDDESRAWLPLGNMQTRRLGGGVGVVRVPRSTLDL